MKKNLSIILLKGEKVNVLKSLNFQINVLHDFDVGKVSQIHKTYLMD